MGFSEFPALSFGLFPTAIPTLPDFLLGGGNQLESSLETLSEAVLQENFGNHLPDILGKIADEPAS